MTLGMGTTIGPEFLCLRNSELTSQLSSQSHLLPLGCGHVFIWSMFGTSYWLLLYVASEYSEMKV